jgi:hypothetical protein
MREKSLQVSFPALRQVQGWRLNAFPGAATICVAAALAGCSGVGSKTQQQTAVDPNLYPSNYRKQIAVYLEQQLSDRADFHGALISQPVLKQVADGASPHYLVCVQFNGHSQIKNKMVLFLAGEITQFVDSTPQQCSDAAYQPFAELESVVPERRTFGGYDFGYGGR